MLKPDENRLNYSQLLTPPPGYEVAFAVGTTYSLSLEALVGVPLSFGLSEELDQTMIENPIYLLEALRKSADKFAIFSQAGQISAPKNNNTLFSLMEDSVFEVLLDNDQSFHPKTWLIKYENDKHHELYRVIVLSRNMTFDRSWDITVALEGQKTEQVSDKSLPLVDFLTFLKPYTTHSTKANQIDQLKNDLKYVQFDPMNNHIADFDFLPIGIDHYPIHATSLFERFHKLIIMSPFISESTIQEFKRRTLTGSQQFPPERVLITRKTELSKLPADILEDYDIYTLKDAVIDGESVISEDGELNEVIQHQDIHAKLYAKSKYNHHTIYMGSANSSKNAFYGNVEFLLKLHYRKRNFRISHILDDLFGNDENNPFEQITEIPESDEESDDITEQLQDEIKKICKLESKATVTAHDDDSYALQINVKELQKQQDISYEIGPLLSKQTKPMQETTLVPGLNVLELGQFYKIKLTKDSVTIERVIKINTIGLPEERIQAVFRSIIQDSHTFLKYIAFLLADDYLMAALENLEKQSGDGSWDFEAMNEPVIYENMLKTSATSPEKLADIEEMIHLIQDDTIIPAEFNQLYAIFKQAIRQVNK